MSLFKERLARAVRANLNELLDRVREFEESGGFGAFGQHGPTPERGWEDIGQGGSRQAHTGPAQDGSLASPQREKSLRDYYANLEVEYGADLPTVKAAYRRLMTRYHPDKHAHDPQMEALATELSQELARAYRAVESYLLTGRY